MRKWLVFLIVGILLLAILLGGHGLIDLLLMFAFFLTDNRAGHFILVLIVLVPLGSMIWGGHVRSRRDSEQAMKQMVDVVRQRTAAMEARIALLAGRASDVMEEGGTGGNQAVDAAKRGAAKGVAVASGFGTAAAGSSSSPGKAGPDQASGNGVAASRDVGGRVKAEDVAGDEGPGWRVLFVDLAKMVVFVSFLALLWAGSAYLFACGEPKLGRLEVSFQKCETRR